MQPQCFGSTPTPSAYAEQSAHVIHFAGDYPAAVSGSVEGATTSGVETARAVAAALDGIDSLGR